MLGNILAFGIGGAILFIFLSIAFFALWIAMLVDAAKRKFKKTNDRVVWVLLIAVIGFVGAVVYYFAVYKNKKYGK